MRTDKLFPVTFDQKLMFTADLGNLHIADRPSNKEFGFVFYVALNSLSHGDFQLSWEDPRCPWMHYFSHERHHDSTTDLL